LAEADSLDDGVRRADLDLWLSSRFIGDEAARADVVAIYALSFELARARAAAREPLIQEIRLAWWRDALEEIASGAPAPKHPVLDGVDRAVRGRNLTKDAFDALVEAAFARLDPAASGAPEAFDRAVMRLAALALWPADAPREPIEAAAEPAARAWSLARAAGRDTGGVGEALAQAGPLLKALPPVVFPAFAHVTLARAYAAGRTPSPLGRRLRIARAVLTGRI
jgi:phytoene synthase